jgi:glycerol-1-phosphate dehydrogenase [NAD(P)+]
VGVGLAERVGEFLRDAGLRGPYLIVTGSTVKSLFMESVLKGIEGRIDVLETSKGDVSEVEEVESAVKSRNVMTVLGVGGGRSIDVAKYVSHRTKIDFVSVPTAPSHDGVTSPFASLKGLGKVVSVKAKEPSIIIADLRILSQAPRRLINAGIGDTVGKLIAVRDWRLAAKLRGEYYGDYTASLALMSAKHALGCANVIERDKLEGVRSLVEALISSGVAMGLAGSTRPASGSEHLFAHAVDMVYPNRALHGELVALGTIMMSYLHGINWKKLRKTLNSAGIPTTAKEVGIPDDVIIKSLTIAHTIRTERYTILGDRGLTWEAAERLASETGVIS